MNLIIEGFNKLILNLRFDLTNGFKIILTIESFIKVRNYYYGISMKVFRMLNGVY